MKINSSFFIGACLVLFFSSCNKKTTTEKPHDFYAEAKIITDQIVVPQFPDQHFSVLDFGALGDGKTDDSQALASAIAACHAAGGGTVILPKGNYLTGPIHLKSNVNLHLEADATVLFDTNPEAYLPMVRTSYEGIECMNYSPLIYAYQEKNIAITGSGTFNGQADTTHWWPWAGKDIYGYKEGMPQQRDAQNIPRLHRFNEEQTPVEARTFGTGHHLRPSFFEPFECENILVSGVTFTNAPFWLLHPFRSKNITIDQVKLVSHGPNNDGCDPEYSQNVWIKNSLFDTGDDCIAIKSGRNEDGRRVNIPSENIVVQNCVMKDGHGGVVMGSEISAGVRQVFVLDNQMDSPNLDRAIRIKTNTLRGGFVDGVYVKNLKVGQVKEAVLKINTFYGIYGVQEGSFFPEIKNIYFENVTAENGGKYGLDIKGRAAYPVQNINFNKVVIKTIEEAPRIENTTPIQLHQSDIKGLN